MSVAIVTGSSGLIGSEAVRFLHAQGMDVVGVDNGMRAYFFGQDGATDWNAQRLTDALKRYAHHAIDIRDHAAMDALFVRHGSSVELVVHCAAQPSHDWAAREPLTDFGINATATVQLLEIVRQRCRDAVVVVMSTNKVYGDTPNRLPLQEAATRWELSAEHPWSQHGIDESMSIDVSLHSVFGAGKVAADVMAQEYGRYFGMKVGVFRGGCLTGPAHSAAELHGFLAYLVKCQLLGRPYNVFGHGGKQVRDNLHARDVVDAVWRFFRAPRPGEVYNLGGGRACNCSIVEAAGIVERITGRALQTIQHADARIGDHMWWISDVRKLQAHFPGWRPRSTIEEMLAEIVEGVSQRTGTPP